MQAIKNCVYIYVTARSSEVQTREPKTYLQRTNLAETAQISTLRW